MTLELLICTIDDHIQKIQHLLLPKRLDVYYLIAWQRTTDRQFSIPLFLQERKDVRIYVTYTCGLSKNRNFALKHAVGDILLIADDDNLYNNSYLDKIIAAFEEYKYVDIITFQAVGKKGVSLHFYHPYSFFYENRPKRTFFSSCEIAIRRNINTPTFNEYFGLGSPALSCGEEDIFLEEAHRKGLKILYLPQVIVRTNDYTTGKKFKSDKKVRKSKGAVLCYLYGPFSAFLRSIRHIILIKDSFNNKIIYLKDMIEGICYYYHKLQ